MWQKVRPEGVQKPAKVVTANLTESQKTAAACTPGGDYFWSESSTFASAGEAATVGVQGLR